MSTEKAAKLPAEIYTDGACLGNPGPGGWGVVFYFNDGSVTELGGYVPETTNNRMEMQAAISALEYLQELKITSIQTKLPLHTDSQYVQKGITQWIKGWKRKGWRTAAGKPVLNQDLWQELDALNRAQIEWRYVRGHAGNLGNERCDEIANGYARRRPPTLKSAPSNSTSVTGLSANPVPSQLFSMPKSLSKEPEMVINDTHSVLEEQLPREVRVANLHNVIETLRIADEIASKGYLISSSELADLMDINASAVTSRGDHWSWRNWVVSRVRREGNQILWQLESVD
ncbi:MAG: ribonuclease HI [Cyanobacteria bacterium P01_H01_bin.15]